MAGDAIARLGALTRQLDDRASVGERLQIVSDAALALTGADHASLRLCAEDGTLGSGARSGVGLDSVPPPFRRGQGVLGWVADTGCVARVPDTARDRRFEDRDERGFSVRSILSAPVIVDHEVRGVLSASAPQTDAFAAEDEHLAVLLTTIAAQQLRIAELSALVITDPHTQAYNRGYLEPRLNEELSRSQRSGEPLSFMLLDLDHFKRVNDGYGHSAGDEVLRRFVQLVKDQIRSADVLIRRGGEEFVVILPATRLDQAQAVAERIRAQLGQTLIRLAAGPAVRQTVSIGVATWNGIEPAVALEQRADAAMYAAKRRGRNRIEAG